MKNRYRLITDESAVNQAALDILQPITYLQSAADDGALDAPEFLPAGSTRSYISTWTSIPVIDGFVLR